MQDGLFVQRLPQTCVLSTVDQHSPNPARGARSTAFAGPDASRTLSHLQPQLVEQHEDVDVVAAGAISCDAAIMAALTIRSSGMAS